METSLALWLVTIAGIVALMAVDFFAITRTPHEVKFKEAMWSSIFYVGVAIAFGVFIYLWQGSQYGTEYFAAYLVEKSLSVDNLFVFIIILTQFSVPFNLHQRVLLVGVALAIVLRGIFIAIGASALALFSFTFAIFGAILVWTGVQLMRHRNDEPDPRDNLLVRIVRKRYRFSEAYRGTSLFITENGLRYATPLLLVMFAIGTTDLIFALDSIPATFGVTQEPYLVFTVNAFALLGLRALYFLLRGLLDKLIYLSLGLSIILVFIGLKLFLTYFHELNNSIPKISTNASLVVITLVLVAVFMASAVKIRSNRTTGDNASPATDDEVDEES
ncbi:MAG: TerC family protein [Actinobacteria bacterium]|jgi:tellurite resistance protein TerC|nr:TerC family protein [Actinomycetota bacterium]MBT5183160.1 TerC family protein [Actinomycetota bacterium]MBT5500861.1 TerC family protein [Actinomycetota bacterium]MBT5805793.1 TerC family protein [Actinomycetota bacterium]MDA9350455.1 TerC family protein [Actinomycetota bacterium]